VRVRDARGRVRRRRRVQVAAGARQRRVQRGAALQRQVAALPAPRRQVRVMVVLAQDAPPAAAGDASSAAQLSSASLQALPAARRPAWRRAARLAPRAPGKNLAAAVRSASRRRVRPLGPGAATSRSDAAAERRPQLHPALLRCRSSKTLYHNIRRSQGRCDVVSGRPPAHTQARGQRGAAPRGRACPSVDVTACASSPTSAARGPWKQCRVSSGLGFWAAPSPSVDVTACTASPTSAARGPWKRAQATTAPKLACIGLGLGVWGAPAPAWT